MAVPSEVDFRAQQQHLQQLVVSLDQALGSLAPSRSKPPRSTAAITRADTHPFSAPKATSSTAGGNTDRKIGQRERSTTPTLSSETGEAVVTPESAAALAGEALAAVKASIALAASRRHGSGHDFGEATPSLRQQQNGVDARELRVALARAIRALRNACVGAASSTAELLGGEDPTGFAEEVRALADAHEKELEQAMAQEAPTAAHIAPDQGVAAAAGEGGEAAGGGGSGAGASTVGSEFWARQSDLWSGVFAEQQAGLLQMVRAQEAELRQGKRRVSSLENELSALSDKHAVLEEASSRDQRGRLSVGELEASEWRQRLERLQRDYERRLSALRERETGVAAAELRVESRAKKLGTEQDRLKAGAVALSAEADALR